MAREKIHREQTRGEELANSISHGAGALLALAGAVPLVVRGAVSGSGLQVVSLSIYAVSLVLLYTASALYHGVKNPALKRGLRVFDHCSIFLLILGTYVPMCLLVIGGRTGWTLVLANATLAAVGITLTAIDLKRFDRVNLVLYALMGWLVVLGIRSVVATLAPMGVFFLAAGGVAYTAGIIFYRSQGKYRHFVWHLFVLLGSALQYVCVALYCI